MKKNRIFSYLAYAVFVVSNFYTASIAWAEEFHLVPDGGKKADGSYTLSDVLGIGLTVVKMILYFSGSVALLAFIYGGFRMIASAGSSSSVEEGKKAITAAVWGLLVVLLAYTIVDFILKTVQFKGYSGWNSPK